MHRCRGRRERGFSVRRPATPWRTAAATDPRPRGRRRCRTTTHTPVGRPDRPRGSCRTGRSGRTCPASCPGRSNAALVVADLAAEPPVVRLLPAEPGKHAAEPWERHRGGQLDHLGQQQAGRQQVGGQRREVGDRATRAVCRGADQLGPRHAQQVEHPFAQFLVERSAGAGRQVFGGQVDPAVRVHPAGAGSGQDPVGVDGQPGRMRQQMPQGRPGRTDLVVSPTTPSKVPSSTAIAVITLVADAQG